MYARAFAFVVVGVGAAACNPGPLDVATIPPASLANSLVAHWTFDETAGATVHDSSGNSRDGSIYGPAWNWIDGRFKGALQLSGADQVTVAGGGFGFPMATANYTISAWLYVSATDVEPPVAAALSNEVPWGVGPPGGWSLSLDAPGPTTGPYGAYRFTYWFGQQPDTSVEASCACVAFDAWTHLAAVIDTASATLTLFVGGKARAQVPITRGIWPAPGALYMGRWPQPGRLLTGRLDDTAIYSRALVPEEIGLLASSAAPDPM